MSYNSKYLISSNNSGLLEYIPGSQSLLIQTVSQPLEGFSENIKISIKEQAEIAKNDVEKGTNFLQWIFLKILLDYFNQNMVHHIQ